MPVRKVHIEACRGPATHVLLKTLLHLAGFQPDTVRERLAMRFLYPLSSRYTLPTSQVSLSDGNAYADQERFYVAEHARRHFRLLANRITDALGPVAVVVYNATTLDTGSQEFVRTLAASGIPLEFELYSGETPLAHRSSLLTYPDPAEEREVAALMQRQDRLSDNERTHLRQAAENYLNVGDSWTSIPMCRRLLEDSPEPELYFMTGMALVLLGRTEEAETYYLRWREAGTQERIDADYVLAMLYVRHHPPYLRSLDRAEDFLDDGFRLLRDSEDANRVLGEIINRNGLALIEYRRGHSDKAAALVRSDIPRLRDAGDGPKQILYKTVLLYNLGVCQQALSQLEQARRSFEELLELDPLMPDHHLNFIRVLLALRDTPAALRHIQIATDLDETFAEAYSLAGYIHHQDGRLEQAIDAYGQAFHLNQMSPAFAYDLAYALNEAGRHTEAVAVLRTHTRIVGHEALTPDAYSLLAEALSHADGLPAAYDTLRRACQIHPTHEDIASNLNQVESAMAATPRTVTAEPRSF